MDSSEGKPGDSRSVGRIRMDDLEPRGLCLLEDTEAGC